MTMEENNTPTKAALFLSAFFDGLIRCGVREVVVSPGSRSTPLALVAYKSDLRLFVDLDERGAAFFALGRAKADGRPVALICTSGTAVANYYPAILEAYASRVPLLILTADRPPLLQNLGAPQTCDQQKIFGDQVRHFQQMPLPGSSPQEIAFARQMALEAFVKAIGSQAGISDSGEPQYGRTGSAGPVHLNFPFDEPLEPDLQAEGLFSTGRNLLLDAFSAEGLSPVLPVASQVGAEAIRQAAQIMGGKRTVVLCGEGSFTNKSEAKRLLDWAHKHHLPLLADPLSNLRSYDDPFVIDNYDKLFGSPEGFGFDVAIRFGQYPVSKSCFSKFATNKHIQIVVDACATRDFNAATDVFIPATPSAFVEAFLEYAKPEGAAAGAHQDDVPQADARQADAPKDAVTQQAYAKTWIARNDAAACHIATVAQIEQGFEGAFVHRLIDLIPEGSCLFSANSLAIRLIDTFYLKSGKCIDLLCNRGLNGIDGTLSSAIGAAYSYEQTTLLTGDLALIHDLNAFALQREVLLNAHGGLVPGIVVVLLNNKGGAIFETLPQKSDEPYFERLFLTPQEVEFSAVARAFGVPFCRVNTLSELESAYRAFCGKPGLHLIEVVIEPGRLKGYYGDFLA